MLVCLYVGICSCIVCGMWKMWNDCMWARFCCTPTIIGKSGSLLDERKIERSILTPTLPFSHSSSWWPFLFRLLCSLQFVNHKNEAIESAGSETNEMNELNDRGREEKQEEKNGDSPQTMIRSDAHFGRRFHLLPAFIAASWSNSNDSSNGSHARISH